MLNMFAEKIIPQYKPPVLGGFFCLLLLGWCVSPAAQTFHFTLFGPQDGLNSPEITALYQDSKGQLWVGTTLGLHVYDGYDFQNIGLTGPVPVGRINDIVEDPYGAVWIAMDRGLGRIRNNTIQMWERGNSLLNQRIHKLYVDGQGDLWLGSPYVLSLLATEQLLLLQRNEQQIPALIQFRDKILSQQIFALEGDENGNLYIGTYTSLLRFNQQEGFHLLSSTEERLAMPTTIQSLGPDSLLWIVYDGNIYQYTKRGIDTLFLSPFHVDKDREIADLELNDRLWGVANGNISQFNNDRPVDYFSEDYWNLTEARGMVIVDRAFWVTFGGGLCAIKPNKVDIYPTPPDWKLKYFNCTLRDKAGNFWLGSTEGLVKVSPRRFNFYHHEEEDELDVYAMETDAEGQLLIGGNQGRVHKYVDGPYYQSYESPAVLPAGEIYDILKDHKGNLWFASYWRGLAHLKNGQVERYLCQTDIDKCIDLNCIYQDRELNLWVGTWYGVTRLIMDWAADTIAKILHYGTEEKPEFIANSITQDTFGMLWVGTDQGLFYFDRQQDQFFEYPLQSSPLAVTAVQVDLDSQLWVTTLGKGIQRYQIEQQNVLRLTQHFTSEDGLATDYYLDVILDDQSTVWAASYEGLSGLIRSGEGYHIINYNAEDGLLDKAYQRLKLYKDEPGRIWGMSTMGLFSFQPDAVAPTKTPLETYFTRIALAGRDFDVQNIQDLPKLPWDSNVLEVEFRAIDLSNPSKIKYSWRLQGLDDTWSSPSDNRRLRFDNLSPRLYTFEVKAANPDGFWNETPSVFAFQILSPWWTTWWAYLIYLVLVSSIAYAIYVYKKSQWQMRSALALEQQEAERLKELDAVKTRLYTNITHEFRTPLTVILGMVQQIKQKPEAWFNEGLKMIERNGQNLLRLVNQMLDLAKLESSTLPLQLIQGDIIAYLKYVVESFHSLARERNVSLQFQTHLEKLTMDYDPDRILDIVSNLLSNAIKFTPKGKEVRLTVSDRQHALGEQQLIVRQMPEEDRPATDNYLILTVQDAGIGIPSEKLPYIFDRFYQVEDDLSRRAEGTGIGLALTKELVNLLGGKIFVESEVGKGTQFTVVLPITKQASLGEATTTEDSKKLHVPLVEAGSIVAKTTAGAFPAKHQRPLLLIAEDNVDVVQYLQSILQEDYRLEIATNGQAGFEKALKLIPDIIISDVMMPLMDGFELCDKLKKEMRTSHIPIILLTAKADVASKLTGLQRGADAYLAKPFHRQELQIRLQKLIEMRKLLQARYRAFTPIPPSDEAPIQTEDAFIIQLRDLMESHFSDENFGVPDLCKLLLMSRSQLYRKVDALTGRPVASYLRSFRLQKAKDLIQSTSLTISEIAFQVGFKDLGHFSRSFRKEFGENPTDLRQ